MFNAPFPPLQRAAYAPHRRSHFIVLVLRQWQPPAGIGHGVVQLVPRHSALLPPRNIPAVQSGGSKDQTAYTLAQAECHTFQSPLYTCVNPCQDRSPRPVIVAASAHLCQPHTFTILTLACTHV